MTAVRGALDKWLKLHQVLRMDVRRRQLNYYIFDRRWPRIPTLVKEVPPKLVQEV